LSLQEKSAALAKFTRELEDLESNAENEGIVRHWSSIFSTFSTSAVISAFGVLNPGVAITLTGISAISALAIVWGAITQHRERSPALERLKKYRLALESDSFLNWACLWEFAGKDSFLDCLYAASSGYLLDGKLVRNDGKNPMASALDAFCGIQGISREVLIQNLIRLKTKKLPQNQKSEMPLSEPPGANILIESGEERRLPTTTTTYPDSMSISVQDSIVDTHQAEQIDVINELIHDGISNSLILGLPGTGKGMLLANAVRAAKLKYPDLNIFVIDPKANPMEIGYFQGIANVIKRCKCEDMEPREVIKWLKECFDDYNQFVDQNGRTLLILDEGTLIGNKANKAKDSIISDKLVSLTSCGDVAGKNIWLAAQSPFVVGLGIDLSISSQLLVIALLHKKNIASVLQQWKRSSMLEGVSIDSINNLISQSPCDRAIFLGRTGKWYSMPTLKNFSSFDRDNRVATIEAKDRKVLNEKIAKISEVERMLKLLEESTENNLEDFIATLPGQPIDSEKARQIKLAVNDLLCNREDLRKKFHSEI
jgi:hypothetical protein